ncbi:hypothetical protein AD30_4639 [Escherichia coli 2-316-03_S4_C3]|nr:hypothetical protein AD30_4639 [Escherichia coli 2-316-03_S4_C3]
MQQILSHSGGRGVVMSIQHGLSPTSEPDPLEPGLLYQQSLPGLT